MKLEEEIRASQVRRLCRSHTQAGKSIKGTNYLVNIIKRSYVYGLYTNQKVRKY